MGILGMDNRTENWKTARVFSPFFEDRSVALAERLGEPSGVEASKVRLELFWVGMRDHIHMRRYGNSTPEKFAEFAERYSRLFPDLRKKIEDFRGFRPLQDHNYRASEDTQKRLYDNLVGTEIDIVLETPNHLFVGEAKHESVFSTNGDLVLVHQLIRQYVMAAIVLDCLDSEKKVVSFIVWDDVGEIKKHDQVKFMLEQSWLKEENILSWRCIGTLAKDG